ncbi:HAD hydrolase-like protein [Actinoplanes sp. NPDC051343]|uniref:HAD hydrolase-like protein n=1 Tax=Actinoplanes sp. NPDC051343 TaxID=3363906 RepID=UPI0037925718
MEFAVVGAAGGLGDQLRVVVGAPGDQLLDCHGGAGGGSPSSPLVERTASDSASVPSASWPRPTAAGRRRGPHPGRGHGDHVPCRVNNGAVNASASLDSILLDLDGTLVDSADGILSSLRAAMAELGIPEPTAGVDRSLLGPPMYATLPPLVGTDAAAAIIPVYRRIYADTGWLLTTPYDGIFELLHDLASVGLRIAIATSKQEAVARMIVEKQGWRPLINDVCGDTPTAGRPTKAAVVGAALGRLNSGSAVMVGDRKYDVAGARQHGIDCVGVSWGYAEPGELTDAGAVAVCENPSELIDLLGQRIF